MEDLTSAVFLQAWRRRAEVVIDRDSSLPWLLGVARRLMETGLINAGFTAPPRRILAAAHVGAVTIRVPAPGPYRVTAAAVAESRARHPGQDGHRNDNDCR